MHVPRTRIERVVRGEKPVTPDTAHRLARLFGTTPGFWLSIDANPAVVSTMSRTGPSAVAVAVRLPWSISAISPRKSPSPSRLISFPSRSIRTDPSSTMKNSPPVAPSRVSTFPSETSTSSISLPRNSTSRRFSPEKSGTAAIRSSLGSVEGTA